MAKKKEIRITCRGAGIARLEDLHPLQGNLKSLSDENYQKLKTSILKHGVSFPFFVWKNKSTTYVLDGHQRDRALIRLKEAGYKIPPLPVAFIEAANQKEAREKILLLSSQYGEMTDESLLEFLNEAELNIEDLKDTVELPGIDLDELLKDLNENDKEDAKGDELEYRVIVNCKNRKDQAKVLARLKRLGLKCHSSQKQT